MNDCSRQNPAYRPTPFFLISAKILQINVMTRLQRYFLMALSVAVLSACSEQGPEKSVDRLVEVQKFSYQSVSQVIDYPGHVQARYQTELAFQVEGQLFNRLVDVGDFVKKGQPIARLDAKDYVLNSERFLNQKKVAEADLKRAENDLLRAETLRKKNFIGDAELDKALNIEKAARAELKALKAEHAQSINRRGYTELLAVADGVMTDWFVEVGGVVQAGEVIAEMAWSTDWEFVTALAETDINQISIGQQAQLKFWAYGDKTYAALVREIKPISSTASPSYRVKLSLIDKPDSLKLGMTGHVLFSTVTDKVGLLPTTSLIQKDQASYVFVVDPEAHTAHLQAVTYRQAVGNQMMVDDGLTEGQLVVVAGAHLIADGNKVRLLMNNE